MKLTILNIILLLVLKSSQNVNSQDIKCKNEFGNFVDWFVVYKLPRIKISSDPQIKKGSGNFNFYPNGNSWTKSIKGLDDPNSILGQNIQLLFTNDSRNIISVLYNDQAPIGPAIDNNGHTKGIVLASASGGIWIQHSLPHFPDQSQNFFTFPKTGYTNGQTFFCMTLTLQEIDILGQIFLITKPNVYSYVIPPNLSGSVPNLVSAMQKRRRGGKSPLFQTFQLATGSLNLMVFAKSPKYQTEIYSDWLSPFLKTSLDVQSWLNGPKAYPSNCTLDTFQVHNNAINQVLNQNFSTHSDHSKWAVGLDKPWTCLADLNRMDHQKLRGGCAICTADKNIWKLFKNTVEDIMPCPKV